MIYIMTCRQVADLFTKVLGPQQFCLLTDKATGYWVRWEGGVQQEMFRYAVLCSDGNSETSEKES